jgi:hypothetical protein
MLSKIPDHLWGPHRLLFNVYGRSFSGIKKPKREVNHSPPSGVEVKSVWSYTSTPPISLYGVERDKFVFFQSRLYCPVKYKILQF